MSIRQNYTRSKSRIRVLFFWHISVNRAMIYIYVCTTLFNIEKKLENFFTAFLQRSKQRWKRSCSDTERKFIRKVKRGFSLFRPWCFRSDWLKRARRMRGSSLVLSTYYRSPTSGLWQETIAYSYARLFNPARCLFKIRKDTTESSFVLKSCFVKFFIEMRLPRMLRWIVLQKQERKCNALLCNFRDFQLAAIQLGWHLNIILFQKK